MSGIGAVWHLDGSAVARSEIERMANVLKPCGPDRQKIWTRAGVALVFCLHSITPEDVFEHQPVMFADRFVLLFDGRIDNRRELGTVLQIVADDLDSMSDSALAIRLFDRWGERGFEKIIGDFAIIFMDVREGRLLCARDHLGMRVLHYHRTQEKFAVATIPEALFALSWVPRVLNKDKIADALVQRGLNGETTYYQGIFRVLPGSRIHVSPAGFSTAQFWNPFSIADVRFKNDHDYVDAFRERLDAAVKSRLRSRRLPCASMTGGLDSSSISVVAADLLAKKGSKLNTFTAVPEPEFRKEEIRGRYFDETPYVNAIAAQNPNIAPHFVFPSKTSIVEQIARQVRVGGDPPSGALNALWVMDLLTAVREAGHTVMLSGEMGNYTMSFDGLPLLAELVQTGQWWRLFGEIAASGYRWKHLLRHRTIAPFIPKPLFRKYKNWRRGGQPPWHDFSAIHPDFAAQSEVINRAKREYLPFDAPPTQDGRRHRILVGLNCYSETADWFAKVRANFGIDIRTPAFDLRVVEFCFGIPQDQYLRKGRDRWLIRRAMQGRLPPAVLDNRKSGAQSADWFSRLTRERDSIKAELSRLTHHPEVAAMVDFKRIAAILNDWPERPPQEFTSEPDPLSWAVPQALGAAFFIEHVTGINYGR